MRKKKSGKGPLPFTSLSPVPCAFFHLWTLRFSPWTLSIHAAFRSSHHATILHSPFSSSSRCCNCHGWSSHWWSCCRSVLAAIATTTIIQHRHNLLPFTSVTNCPHQPPTEVVLQTATEAAVTATTEAADCATSLELFPTSQGGDLGLVEFVSGWTLIFREEVARSVAASSRIWGSCCIGF